MIIYVLVQRNLFRALYVPYKLFTTPVYTMTNVRVKVLKEFMIH